MVIGFAGLRVFVLWLSYLCFLAASWPNCCRSANGETLELLRPAAPGQCVLCVCRFHYICTIFFIFQPVYGFSRMSESCVSRVNFTCCDLFNQPVRHPRAHELPLLFRHLCCLCRSALCEFNATRRASQTWLPHLICIIFMKITKQNSVRRQRIRYNFTHRKRELLLGCSTIFVAL